MNRENDRWFAGWKRISMEDEMAAGTFGRARSYG